jgi:hypothetical protein
MKVYSPQVLYFEKMIAAAELGDEAAIKECRRILAGTGEASPLCDLIKLCRCFLDIARDHYTE